MIWPRSHMCLEALPSSHLVPAPQIRAHDFWRYINLYSRMYVCRSLLGRGGRLLYVEHLLSSAVPGLACVLVADNVGRHGPLCTAVRRTSDRQRGPSRARHSNILTSPSSRPDEKRLRTSRQQSPPSDITRRQPLHIFSNLRCSLILRTV